MLIELLLVLLMLLLQLTGRRLIRRARLVL